MVDSLTKKEANDEIKSNLTPKMIRGRQKKIKISDAIVDGNTVQMPFLVPYRGTPITLVEFFWNSVENGKTIKRGLKVSGHGEYGVPTLKEKSVLMALQNIYIESKLKNGILKLEPDETKVSDDELFIDFQDITYIAHEMGLKTINTVQKENIKKSIEILVATTMINKANGGLYDPETKKYITSAESYRYLESMENYTFYDCENCLYCSGCDKNTETCKNKENKSIDVTKIKISRFFYKCIANNFSLIYEKDKSNQIKNLAAKNMYLISLRWLDKNSYTSVVSIEKYMERLPMNMKTEKHRRQYIKDTAKTLNKYSFVDVKVQDNLIIIKHLDRIKNKIKVSTSDNNENDTSYLKHKYNSYKEVEDKLKEYGFSEKELEYYLSFDMLEHIKYIQALMRYTEILDGYNKIKDLKGFIKTGLNFKEENKKPYNIDEKYFSK